MALSLALHVIGIVMWLGGLMIVTRLMKLSLLAQDMPRSGREAIARTFSSFALPGALLATLTGLFQLVVGGVQFYMQAGWFHAKLTLVITLYVVTVVVFFSLKKFVAEQDLSPKKCGVLHAISGALLLAIVCLTFLGRIY
ncbi:MAG: CopD family protein [Bdellovibrionales bacterium]|nr:CopD family protein [Bdellovibrionales bacterium]